MSSRSYATPNATSKPIGAFFRWEIAGEAVGVHLSLNVIELLERDAAKAAGKVAAGVLLGRMHHGRELTLIAEHYESATPEFGASDSPFANAQAVERMLDRWRPGRSRMSVLGFYRSCAEETVLNATDLSAVQATLLNQGGATGGTEPVAGATKTEDSPSTRAGIQDPERIFLLIEPRAGRLSTASLYLARKGVVVCQSPRIPFNRAELAKNGTSTEAQAPEKYRATTYSTPDVPVERERKPAASRTTAATKFMPWLKRYQWIVFGLSALPLMVAVFISARYNQSAARPTLSQAGSADSELGLKLERSGAAWKLSWDADAPSVQSATEAHLLISDGVIHRDMPLSSSDLRGGTIIYTPMTDDVVLQLQLNDPGAAEPLSASVRTVGGGGSSVSATSLPSPGIPALVTSNVPPLDESELRAPVPQPVPAVPTAPISNKTVPAPLKPERPVRPIQPERRAVSNVENISRLPVASSSASVTPATAPETLPRLHAITQNPLPSHQTDTATVPTWPPSSTDTPAIAVAEKPADRANAIEVARLVSRDDPVYPPTAKELGLAGTVEVHFKIGKDGQVRDVNVTNGFDALGQAAIDAVRKWRYSPAKIDGVPTESEASAVFVFKKS
jgi:protein TonB